MDNRAEQTSNVLFILFIIALILACFAVVVSDDRTTPTPTPRTPPLSVPSGTCALIVYEDATAHTIEGEPTFTLAQGAHTETDGLTADLEFYRINEQRGGATITAYLHVTAVVPRDVACLERLPLLTDVLPRMAIEATP